MLATNVEFWAAIVLDFAEVPAHMFTSMFTCARTAGWAAHILEQKRTGRLVRPSAGTWARPRRRDVPGADKCSTGSDASAGPELAGRRRGPSGRTALPLDRPLAGAARRVPRAGRDARPSAGGPVPSLRLVGWLTY